MVLLHEGEAMVADFGIALAAGAAPGERLTKNGPLRSHPRFRTLLAKMNLG